MIPPAPQQQALLEELQAAAQHDRVVSGTFLKAKEAQDILTLCSSLDPVMQERLLAKTVPDMLSTTMRIKAISRDSNWCTSDNGRKEYSNSRYRRNSG